MFNNTKFVSFFLASITLAAVSFSMQRPAFGMSSDEEPRFRYLFFQQTNDMCTIAPMLNRHRLQELKRLEKPGQSFYDQAFDDPMLALTSRQWFGESHHYLFAWRRFLTDFMHTDVGRNYLAHAAKDGLVMPYFYRQDGAWLYKINKDACQKYPYFFADITIRKNIDSGVHFCIPIVHPLLCVTLEDLPNESVCSTIDPNTDEESGWLIYNKGTKEFEHFTYANLQNNPIFSSIKASLMPRLARQVMLTPFNATVIYDKNHPDKKKLGWRSIILPHQDWISGFDGKMPYCLGFLKLMFLTLGINNNNEFIADEDSEMAVTTTMKVLIQADKDHNPWSDEFFKKEYFMQYALAEILKTNPTLFENATKTIDVFGSGLWPTYENVVTGKVVLYKDNQGTPYDHDVVVRYLPGRYQALAYFVTQALRYLWYGAVSKNAFAYYRSLNMYDPDHPRLSKFKIWFSPFKFSRVKSRAEKRISGISFLSVWSDLKKELQRRYPDIKDWVSFDDHGWVISFDENLIKKQREVVRARLCDYELLDQLGFAGIESWWGHELETFYKG